MAGGLLAMFIEPEDPVAQLRAELDDANATIEALTSSIRKVIKSETEDPDDLASELLGYADAVSQIDELEADLAAARGRISDLQDVLDADPEEGDPTYQHTDPLTLAERLNAQLNEALEEVAKHRSEVASIKSMRPWTEHRTEATDPRELPVPRLEMSIHKVTRQDQYGYEARYDLVYPHFTGSIVWVPMGSTLIGGGGPLSDDYMPFRDGAHIMHDAETLRLPAFLISLSGTVGQIPTK